MANEIYKTTWWGNPTNDGWGNIYYDYIDTIGSRFVDRVIADGGTVESTYCFNL